MNSGTLISPVRRAPERMALLGVVVNTGLAFVKLAAGVLGHSFALVADAVESLVDIAGSAVVWSAMRYGSRPPDAEHPFGHGKAEAVAGLLVAGLVVAAGVGIAAEAVRQIVTPHTAPAPFTLIVLVAVIAIKETLARFAARAAARAGSSAGAADAWHHRADAITSLFAFAGISVALIGGEGWARADDVAALLASGVIVFNGVRIAREPWQELLDRDRPEVARRACEIALTVPGVLAIERCDARRSGRGHLVVMHAEVAPDMSVEASHRITGAIKGAVRSACPEIDGVLVHIEPGYPPGGKELEMKTPDAFSADSIRDTVRKGYAEIARKGVWSGVRPASARVEPSPCCAGGGCCGPTTLTPEQVAQAVGYDESDLASLPDGANMGLSCGNPTALASLKPGEVVLDLGSGGGFDCFIAGPRVGATGRVIGVDMTAEMIGKARANLAGYEAQTGLRNVEFRLGEIEHLPVADASVDVVISNCVINLSPDKARVWREIARVLRPGGRVAVSDLALLRPLPEGITADLEALVGCVAGAQLVDEVRAAILAAGLTEAVLTPKPGYIQAMTTWQDPLYKKIAAALPEGTTMSDFVVSLDIAARKA
jgi:cation diffusion facilitator family transporter